MDCAFLKSVVLAIVGILLILCIILVGFFVTDYYAWERAPIIAYECKLISRNIATGHNAPTHMKIGSSCGGAMLPIGGTEKIIPVTVWDCGVLGILTSDDEEVFRYAHEVSILKIKEKDGEAKIVGIEHDKHQ